MLTVECTCRPDEPYADGTLPLFYDDPQEARNAYIQMKFNRPLYWGIHWNGQHLVGKINFYLRPWAP